MQVNEVHVRSFTCATVVGLFDFLCFVSYTVNLNCTCFPFFAISVFHSAVLNIFNCMYIICISVVVFKPCHASDTYCKVGCSSGYVHDMEIVFSVGLTIGSGT